ELRGLAKLLPDNGRTESTPLVEQFQEILNRPHEGAAPEQEEGRGAGEMSRADWKYSIEPHKPGKEDFSWTPAAEAEATMWVGFRERGDDKRVFGVFPSRKEAEQTAKRIKARELKHEIKRGMER